MSGIAYTRKKFTLLVRKLTLEHDLLFVSISQNGGESKPVKATSECILNEEIQVTLYDDNKSNSFVDLHILSKENDQEVVFGSIRLDTKSQKIMKPLSKEFFSKQFSNKKGYIEYKFIGVESKNVTQQQFAKQAKIKNELAIRINQQKVSREEMNSMMELIDQKDQIIAKLRVEIQKLIQQTKKLNKSLSKQKAFLSQQVDRNISLNIKVNPSTSNLSKMSGKNLDWEREREQYEYEIQRMSRRIRDFQSRQRQYNQQIQLMRRKMEVDVKDNQRKISDLRKEIEDRYEREFARQKRFNTQEKQSENEERDKKNRYIEEQLSEQLRKIEAQKDKQYKRDIERELRLELQIQNDRQRERERQKQKEKERQKSRERSRAHIRQSSADHKEFLKEIDQLELDKQILKQKLAQKQDQINKIVLKLERAQKQITKLEDQNIELRKTKSSLLREVDGIAFKSDIDKNKQSIDRQPIEQYEKMIINERKQIVDEKLRAEIEELRAKIRKDEKQNKQKLQEKDLEIMKLRLSEKSANRQKEIYSTRIQQIMANTDGDRKNYLEAQENARKFETQQARAKQLQIANNELESNNYRLNKQKQQIQNAMKKLKSKIDERQGQWVRLKSIEAQHDYYKNQCQKFEKGYKKFEKQYDSIKQYCLNLEHIVGRKPRKTFDEQLNKENEQRYKNEIRNRLQVLMQEVKDMENKFYLEQIQIWLTQRTNAVQYYAKKFEDDKARILQMDNINEQARNNLIEEKQKQINQLKDQELNDIDRKIAKIKALVRNEEQKLVGVMIDKASFEHIVHDLSEKIQKLRQQEETRKKEVIDLKQKNVKLESEIKQKSVKMNKLQYQNQKKSLSLYPEDKDQIKGDDARKSFIDEFKKSRDFYMNKPFDELKKLNAQLQTEKRKVETQMNTIKFNFDKERVQLNDKIRTKQRQLKKLQHEASTNEKAVAKYQADIENMRKNREELESLIKKMREQLKQLSRNLELKQRQCSEALSEIKRMEKNLTAYEEAQKKMFDDVKKMKEKLEKKQLQMEQIMEERNQKSKQIDAERVHQISQLEQKVKELQFKLQKQITENLAIKNENETLSQTITEYEVKLKNKEEQYEALDENFTIYKTEWGQKLQQFEQQNSTLQTNIMEIANQMQKKQSECCELQIKIEYGEKRQDVLKNIKNQLEEQNNQLKEVIKTQKQDKIRQLEKFNEQMKSLDLLKEKVDAYIQQNARLNLEIKEFQEIITQHENNMHEMEKEMIRTQGEKKNLETEIYYIKQNFNDKVKQLESAISEKQSQIQRLQKEKNRVSFEQKPRKSSQLIDQSPNSPMLQRKLLNTSIQRSNSLAQNPKSNRSIGGAELIKKSSIREQQQKDQLYFSKQGIEVNVKKPTQEVHEQAKLKIPQQKKQLNQNDSSKVDIDLNQSVEENQRSSRFSSLMPSREDSLKKQQKEKDPVLVDEKHEQEQGESEQGKEFNNSQMDEDGENLQQRLEKMEIIIEELTNERDNFLRELNQLRSRMPSSQIQPNNSSEDRIKIDYITPAINKSIHQECLRKMQSRQTPPQKSFQQINVQSQRLSIKKIEELEKEAEEMKNKIIQYELALTENQNQIKDLEHALSQERSGQEKLIAELDDTMKKLQEQVDKKKQIQAEMQKMEQKLMKKISQISSQLQQIISESLKKDETIHQTMSLIQNLNSELKGQQKINQSLQLDITNLNKSQEKTNRIIENNKNQYRKYEEEAELQILRLKEKVDELNLELTRKDEDIEELAGKYLQLEETIKQINQDVNSKQNQVLTQRSKLKQAILKRDQAIEQMKKYENSKNSMMKRMGDLEIKLGQKNQQLKQLAKETAIAYKKYEIQLETQREQHDMSKKKLKEREEHICNLKLELANYNDKCYESEREKNALKVQLVKLEKQIREIMVSYQQQLDDLNKDKIGLAKQLENYQQYVKQSQVKFQALNKEAARRNRQIKQLNDKIEDQQSSIQKIKEKHRREIKELVAQNEMKNDEYHKIKIQLQRETQHYFAKQCQYLAEKEKKDKEEADYASKLQEYEKVLKELEEELKEVQNRPSSDQWEEICFENQLYKNRIEELEGMLRQNGEQQQQRIMSQFKRYKFAKQKQIEDLQIEMQKYSSKFHNLQQNIYVLKKDNDTMKGQLRTTMQQKMKLQKNIKQYEEDIRQLKEQVNFYKAKRVEDLNKLLNQSYD